MNNYSRNRLCMNKTDNAQIDNGSWVMLRKALGFFVNNAFSFTVGVMGFVHAVLLVVFWIAGVMPMVIFDAFSVVIYTFCYILCRVDYILPAYASIILEVTIYSVVSTYYVGLRCGTYCFLFSIIPIIIYFGSSLFKGKQRWGVVLMLVLNFVMFAELYICFFNIPPVYTVSAPIMLFLVVFSAFAMVFATLLYNAMYIYSSENRVTILEQKNRQLSVDAHEDELTSLLNRRGFLPLVKSFMNSDEGDHFSIAFCDLDDFKRVNDSYGHEAGDEVLKHITQVIRQELPGCDICRWGGEEFVILMKHCDMVNAKGQLERLRKTVESNPTSFFSKQIFVTLTIGLEEYNESYTEPEAVIKKADERMYYGKQHGKNIVVFEDND